MKFWTCGPFKEVEDRIELANFKIAQQMMLQSILDELESINELYEKGTTDEMLLAAMMKPDVEKKLNTILGIENDDGQAKSDEILRETILKSISGVTKE